MPRKRATRKKTARKPKLGSGQRFKTLSRKLAKKGVRNPNALAATIGRKKLGAKRMAKLSAQGRKRKARARSRKKK
jgi:hypothetical protein